MKIVGKIVIFIIALVIMIMPVVACGEPAAPSEPTKPKIALSDGPTVLDMSPDLPGRFEQLDAASEGLSNKDLGLGPDFSEVELFLSVEPYQMIFVYLCIVESKVERASADAVFKDEEQVKSIILEGLRIGVAEEGMELSGADVEITYPKIGDLAVFGSGTMSTYGMSLGYDLLFFKVGKVYVFIGSNYLPGESQPLVPIAREIEHRIGMFSQ